MGRLGAPWQYLNASVENMRGTLASPADRSVVATTMKRLHAVDPSEYIAKLLQCRTSSNGVFGLKARFDDFSSAIDQIPELLSTLAPVSYIYVDCHDKLTQAVSVVRALFAGAGAIEPDVATTGRPLRYNRELISKYLGRLERQRLDWWRWFEANGIEPFVIYCEDANTDIGSVVAAVEEFLGVHGDAIDEVKLPPFAPSHDATTAEWAARFTREVESGIDFRPDGSAADESHAIASFEHELAVSPQEPHDSSSFYLEIQKREAQPPNIANAAVQDSAMSTRDRRVPWIRDRRADPDVRKMRRYDKIIGQNGALLQNVGVLDLMSGGGLCAFAALDAGAEFVVGVDPRADRVAAARQALADHGLPENSFRFVNMEIMPALYDTNPKTFEVIIARGVLESLDVREFFAQLSYLKPRHVILDTAIAAGIGPLIRYGQHAVESRVTREPTDQYDIVAMPSHELIVLLCDCFGFECRFDDEGSDSFPAEAQINAGRAQIRTYVLDRIA